MSTIQQVLADANDATKPLDSVLRSAMVLAYSLDYEPLITWVNAELDGFETNENMPDYRRFRSEIRANFLNPFQPRNKELVPLNVFPEEWRDAFSTVQLLVGVRALEDTAGRDDLIQPLPDFTLNYLTENAAPGFVCQSAWLVIPPGSVAQVLSAVRTRLLRLCLTLQRQFPHLTDETTSNFADPVPPPAIAYYFNTIVMGQNASVALGGDSVFNQVNHVRPADFNSLRQSLLEFGVAENDIESLATLTGEINSEVFAHDPSAIQRFRDWSAEAARKAFGGIPGDARGYLVEVVIKLIALYYGVNLP